MALKHKKKDAHALAKKFHSLLKEWTAHIRDELRLHRQMEHGRHPNLKQHVRETIKIEQRFLKKLKKF